MEIQKGLWRHSKSGREYEVLHTGYDSETMGQVVVYQAQYNSKELGPRPVFVRPADMWSEQVEVNGGMVPRFVKCD